MRGEESVEKGTHFSDYNRPVLDNTRVRRWCRKGRRATAALAFPGEIFEHIFTSILRARLCRMQIAAAVSRDVWPRMGGAQYSPDGEGHPTCTIRRNTRRDNILLYKWHLAFLPLRARTWHDRLSPLDFHDSAVILAVRR